VSWRPGRAGRATVRDRMERSHLREAHSSIWCSTGTRRARAVGGQSRVGGRQNQRALNWAVQGRQLQPRLLRVIRSESSDVTQDRQQIGRLPPPFPIPPERPPEPAKPVSFLLQRVSTRGTPNGADPLPCRTTNFDHSITWARTRSKVRAKSSSNV